MKILHIIGDSKWGGGGSVILALARMAQSAGWQVDVLCTNPVCQEMFRARGVGVVDLDVIWRNIRPLRDLRGLRRLRRFLESHPYDLVHTHTSKAGFVGRVAARRAGFHAVVHTAHSFPFHEESGAVASFAYRLLERFAANYCDRIVTVSHFHRQWGLSWNIAAPQRIVAIPNGIAEESVAVKRDRDSIRDELRLQPSEIFFLTPGRLFRGKGLEYLLDAIPILDSRLVQPFRIVLAGDGPQLAALQRRAADRRAAGRIIFLGFRTDIPDLLHACDAVVLPTLHEGMSISLLEAMALAKPIVTTSIGGNVEATGQGFGALLVPPKDTAALAEGMITLARNSSVAAEKAKHARLLFLSHHTREIMVRRYWNIYCELLGTASAARAPSGLPVEL